MTDFKLARMERLVNAVINRLVHIFIHIDANELEQAREHVRSSLILENDDLEASMEMIAREYIYLGRVPELEARLKEYDVISKSDLQQVLETAWKQRAFFRSGPGCD